MTDMNMPDENPLVQSDVRDQRIRERAYSLWEADGRPEGRDLDYWERSRELDAISSHPTAGQLPIEPAGRVDEAAIQQNLGEFPDRSADQGERLATPMTRAAARKEMGL